MDCHAIDWLVLVMVIPCLMSHIKVLQQELVGAPPNKPTPLPAITLASGPQKPLRFVHPSHRSSKEI